MDDHEALVTHHAERNLPNLAIVGPIVELRYDFALKDAGGTEQVYAANADDLLALGFVPLEVHSPSCVHNSCTYFKFP